MSKKLILSTLVLLASSAAIAADRNLYSDLDTNQDGAISKDEAAALPGLNEKWVELDQNADGVLDPAEFAKLEFIGTEPE